MMIFVYITALVLLAAYALLLQYYFRSWKDMPAEPAQPALTSSPHTRVSIIVPARNEERDIASCIQSILQQRYPSSLMECIIVDDHSEDNTARIVKQFDSPILHLISLHDQGISPSTNSYKKKALEAGIAGAGGELIITTDADCTMEQDWLNHMVAHYEKTGDQFIAAPVKIKHRGGWLSIFQVLDFTSLQGITAASVHRGFHSMCNGANLAYTKNAFYTVEGFRDIDRKASGDDMLLMHKIARKFPGKVGYLKNKAVVVTTNPQPTLRAFFQQRIRWASKAQDYKDKNVFRVLLLVYTMNLLLLTILIAGFFSIDQAMIAVGFLLLKVLVEWRFMYSVSSFYQQQNLMVWFPLFQPIHILYTVIAGSFGQFGQYEWKGRRVS